VSTRCIPPNPSIGTLAVPNTSMVERSKAPFDFGRQHRYDKRALVFPPGERRGPVEQPDPASKGLSGKVPPRKGSTNPSISKGTSSAQRQELVDLDPHPKAFGDRREPQHHFPRVMDQAPRRMQEQKAQPLGTCRQHLGGQRQPLQRHQPIVGEGGQPQPSRIRPKILRGQHPGGQRVLQHIMHPLHRSGLLAMPSDQLLRLPPPQIAEHRKVTRCAGVT